MIDLYLVKRNVRKKRNSDTYVVEIEGEVFGHVNGKDSFWRAERLEEDKRVIDPVLWGRDFNTSLLTGGWFISKEGAVDYLVMVWVYFDMEPKLLRFAKEEAEERQKKVSELQKHFTLLDTGKTYRHTFGAELTCTIYHKGAVQPCVKYTVKSRNTKIETADLQEAIELFLEIGLPLSVVGHNESDKGESDEG